MAGSRPGPRPVGPPNGADLGAHGPAATKSGPSGVPGAGGSFGELRKCEIKFRPSASLPSRTHNRIGRQAAPGNGSDNRHWRKSLDWARPGSEKPAGGVIAALSPSPAPSCSSSGPAEAATASRQSKPERSPAHASQRDKDEELPSGAGPGWDRGRGRVWTSQPMIDCGSECDKSHRRRLSEPGLGRPAQGSLSSSISSNFPCPRSGLQMERAHARRRDCCHFRLDTLRSPEMSSLRAASRGPSGETKAPATETTTTAKNKPPSKLLISILLAAVWLLVATSGRQQCRAQPERPQVGADGPAPAPKLALWRALLEPLARELGAPSEAAQRLALKLAQWPDQRRSALFYLELLARRPPEVAGSGGPNCRAASLAELTSERADHLRRAPLRSDPAGPEASPAASHELDLEALVALDELPAGSALGQSLSSEQSVTGDLAKLAVENANLISRLLIQPPDSGPGSGGPSGERRPAGHSQTVEGLLSQLAASPKFFKYLLESKVASVASGLEDDESSLGGPEEGAEEAEGETDGPNQWASGQRGPRSRRRERGRRRRMLHSIGLAFVEPPAAGEAGSEWARPGGETKIAFAPLALAAREPEGSRRPVQVVELSKHSLAASGGGGGGRRRGGGSRNATDGYLGGPRPASFLSKWFLANNLRQLFGSRLEPEGDRQQVGAEARPGAALGLADGRWFSPHFDCELANRWLLTYSIPFFGLQPNGSIQFR